MKAMTWSSDMAVGYRYAGKLANNVVESCIREGDGEGALCAATIGQARRSGRGGCATRFCTTYRRYNAGELG